MDKVVDYLVYEQSQVRSDRVNRRLWILCIILTIFLFVSNAGWIYYESQFTDTTTTIEAQQDGSGTNIVGGGDRRFIDGCCYEPLAEEFDMSVAQVKRIVYKNEIKIFNHI